MHDDPPLTDPPSELERLTALFAGLAKAGGERALLDALSVYFEPWGPIAIYIIYFDLNPEGLPSTGVVMMARAHGRIIQGIDARAGRFAVDQLGLEPLWLASPEEPLIFNDVTTDARANAALRARTDGEGYRALIALPLFSAAYGGWQGMVTLNWPTPRTFSAEQRLICRLLIAELATHVGGWRSRDALRTALEEAESLQRISKRLNEATNLDEMLAALASLAPSLDEATATLMTFDDPSDPASDAITILHRWSPAPSTAWAPTGTSLRLGDHPVTELFLRTPGEPAFLCDSEEDPGVDPRTRAYHRKFGIRAALSLLLTLQGRRVGIFTIAWPKPMPLGAREHRLFSALSTQAALLIENRLVLDRLHASLEKSQQKSAMLSTLTDHLPVGVMLFSAPSGARILANPAARRLFQEPDAEDPHASPRGTILPVVDSATMRELSYEELPARETLRTGQICVREVDIVDPSGGRVHVEATAAPVRGEAGSLSSVVLMLSDITPRKAAESERARLQEEVIRAQAATLAELSLPLIPITDDILVLPLIGSLSAARSQQMMDALLTGTSRSRARAAILDITGVRMVDTQAASMLTSAAQALRLLGVEPILTGIQPDVAQTLVSLGVSLDGITTRGTLQSGIQYALGRLSRATFR